MQRDNWIGTRDKDNFAYTLGQKSVYSKSCKNSLIITDKKEGLIHGRSNHALIQNKGKSYLIPITKIDRILEVSEEMIGFEKIFYKKPNSILEREILIDFDEEFIRKNIFENYRIQIDSIKEIETKKGNHRVYEVSSEENKKFMLKYHGKDLKLFDAQIKILQGNPFFPKIIPTKNLSSHLCFGDSVYYLEDFVEGNPFPLNKDSYYNLAGKYLALLHNKFNKKIILTNNLESILSKESDNFSESNLVSMSIDLMNSHNNESLLRELNSIQETFSQRLNILPNQIIHGDLNKSNLIWQENTPTLIDFETIALSKRVNEFIPALLFEGNLSIPKYDPQSLKEILNSYNFHSHNKLTQNELVLLPDLLKISPIKSYVIYTLRRNLENESFKHQIEESLKTLEKETDVH
jgi:Ser/Thr protein kinase RdoA (MazF antagonist)